MVNNLGLVYQGLGERERALPQFEEALRLWRAVGDRAGEASTLSNLGLLDQQLGRPREALSLHAQAIELHRALGDRRGEGIALIQLGRAAQAADDLPAAGVDFDRAIERLRAAGDPVNEAEALRSQGEAQAAMDQPERALANLGRAVELARAAGQRTSETYALCALARVERSLGRGGEALHHVEAALALAEDLRTRIGSPDLRAAFSAVEHQAFELHQALLMAAHRAAPGAGHDRAALESAERARARTLVELLGEAGVDARAGIDPALRDRRNGLLERLHAKRERALRATDAAARATLDAEEPAIRRDVDLVEAEIRERHPGYAALTRPRPLGAAEIQALLDPGTLLLSYSLGEERSFLWAVTATSLESFELPGRTVLEAAARRLHELWSRADVETRGERADAAGELSRLLLGPVADRLDRQRLAVVPDGALEYLSFAALPLPPLQEPQAALPREPVIARHEVVYLPSASALAMQRRLLAGRPRAAKWLAVIADPVFDRDDPRVTGRTGPGAAERVADRGEVFARLPATRREAAAIAALAPPGEAWTALDFAASRPQVLGDRLRGYRVVHFATHGVIDAGDPARSGLALSMVGPDGHPQDGFLALPDVYDLRLDADLVVLSGCRTALGKEVRGEGLIGLTRGFQYAGAPRVVASLWQVEDEATAALMTRFYRAMWRDGLAPAAALRAAQLAIRGERRWRDPYFWAGFVLTGSWQ